MKKEIKKLIEDNEWVEEEAQVSIHILDHWKTCYVQGVKYYEKWPMTMVIFAVRNGYAYEWTMQEHAKELLTWLTEIIESRPEYFEKKYQEFRDVSEDIREIFLQVRKDGVNNMSSEDITTLFDTIYELGNRQYGYALAPEALDVLNEQDYFDRLPGVPDDEKAHVLEEISLPEESSFLEKEHLDLISIVIAIHEGHLIEATLDELDDKMKDMLASHAEKFFWVQNSFSGAKMLDEEYFFEKAKELAKEKTTKQLKEEQEFLQDKKRHRHEAIKNLEEKYAFSHETKSFFHLVRMLSFIQDMRKENIMRLAFVIDAVLHEAERRFDVPFEDLDSYNVDEVKNLYLEEQKVSKEDLAARQTSVSISRLVNGEITNEMYYGDEGEEIIQGFLEKQRGQARNQELKGFIASRGDVKRVKGKVRIVFDPSNDEFHQDEILVAGMTRPEYVGLMKKAKAIITNEGGITSHAAIVSRELKKPCIIGTKVATDVLKDGDEVELNLEDGSIHKTE